MAELVQNDSSGSSIKWESLMKHTVTYHTLPNQQHLQVDILLPPSLTDNKSHPLIIAYHGGGLIGGDRGGYEYMNKWLPAYAVEANAIIVSPDYRLLPKATARDVRQDLDALWKWVQSSLNSALDGIIPGHTADLSRILGEGGSAGGFCAAHIALSYPNQIRAAILVYPMVDGFHEQGLVKQKLFPANLIPNKEELTSWIKKQRSQEDWAVIRNEDVNYLFALFQDQATFLEVFGSDDDLSPAFRVTKGGDATGIPEKLWIFHGADDSLVPAKYSQKLAETLKARGWSSNVRLTIVDEGNSEHGFDSAWTGSEEKLAQNLSCIKESWLK